MIIPTKVAIETIFGCNLSCTMCDIDAPTGRKKGVMPMTLFQKILDDLVPIRENIAVLDLFCLGEPLLDPFIFRRIQLAKKMSFVNVGISTNADIMTHARRESLLKSGIDTVIISIDGARKETHEAIRHGSLYERTVENTLALIVEREHLDSRAKIVIRFIRQETNRAEWESFRDFWIGKINPERGDKVGVYDVHAQGPSIRKADALAAAGITLDPEIERAPCPIIREILYILSDGTIVPCSQDWLCARHSINNAAQMNVLDAYNSNEFAGFRKIHDAGEKKNIPMCAGCTIAYSDARKEYS